MEHTIQAPNAFSAGRMYIEASYEMRRCYRLIEEIDACFCVAWAGVHMRSKTRPQLEHLGAVVYSLKRSVIRQRRSLAKKKSDEASENSRPFQSLLYEWVQYIIYTRMLLLAFIGLVAATTVTLQVIGESGVRAHRDNEVVYMKSGTSVRVRVCLVFPWMYVDGRHTPRCSAAMADCTCFVWQNSESGTACTDLWLTDTAVFTWYLLPKVGAMVLPSAGVLQYAILRERWPNYTFAAFSTAYCMRAWPVQRPPEFVIRHTVPVVVVVPEVHVVDDVTWIVVLIYVCAAIFMAWIANE